MRILQKFPVIEFQGGLGPRGPVLITVTTTEEKGHE